MKKIALAAILAALVPALAVAAPQPRAANNESSCTASGMGMDPRCVGDVDTSSDSALSAGADEVVQPVVEAPTKAAAAPVAKKKRNL
jgi:hypothetical protein